MKVKKTDNMNHYQTKEGCLNAAEAAHPGACSPDPKDFLPGIFFEDTPTRPSEAGTRPYLSSSLRNSAGTPEIAQLNAQSPYATEVEADCEGCGGSGFDPGGIDPWGPEPCPACQGAKTQRIIRNYLAEAFRIVGNPECRVPTERAHLVAIVHFCRQAVSAVVSLPEVPECTQARLQRSSRHGRAEVIHTREVNQIARRKRNVDISPQRA
jgi:hypothetical protein